MDDAPSIATITEGGDRMKFSISLPTGFEGVMYPVPFVDPSDFVRMAQLCEKLGYHSVWGNDHIQSQHYVRELYPEFAAQLLRAADGAVVLRRGDDDARGRHRARRAADARSVLARQDRGHHRPALQRPADPGAGHRRLSRGVRRLGAAARAQGAARRDDGRGPRADAAPVHRAAGHARGQVLRRQGHRDVSQAQARSLRAVARRAQQGDHRAHGAPRHRLAAGLAAVARARRVDQDPEGPRRRARPRSEGDRDRAAVLGDHRQDAGGGREALHGVGPGRAPQVARLHRPRPLQAGRGQPRRLARPDPREGRGPAQDRRRPRLRPDDPGRTRWPSSRTRWSGSPRRCCSQSCQARRRRCRNP